MIDVVFLLLAYFIVTTVITQREDRLSPNLSIEDQVGGASARRPFKLIESQGYELLAGR